MARVLIGGDFVPTGRVAGVGERGELLAGVEALTRMADYSVVNFECAVADAVTDKPILKSGPHLRCSAEWPAVLKKAGFDCLTLANNHFADYGETGVKKSLDAIDWAGLDHVGGGRNLMQAQRTLYKEIGGQTFAFINCCEHEFSIAGQESGGCNPLNPIDQYYAIGEARQRAQWVVVIVHGGVEHLQLPTPRMQQTYRFFVDAGADAVVNHHQHCYGPYEFYKGRPIVYGLGNLLFDDPAGVHPATWKEGYLAELDFGGDQVELKLHPYRQCDAMVGVEMLDNRAEFDRCISRLNSIVADSAELRAEVERLYDKEAAATLYLLGLKPGLKCYLHWSWRRLRPANRRRQLYNIKNQVVCESLHDRLAHILQKKTPPKED